MRQKKKHERYRYQLRHAAGMYWLIDMEQTGVPFRKPVPMNETGAYIWNLLEQGQIDTAVQKLQKRYRLDQAQACRDVEQFLETLRMRGISI